ncbi:MAG: TetR/AcrR family transcriptional regulator [Bacillota bacterium]|nr:TetR/AcrR family transcriptional regulator [Bacillota bacterium]
MSSNNDLRVVKTRRLIIDAFVKLLDEKGFKNITVNDISDKAMINRSTFYLHYMDKFDLLQKLVNEAIENILCLVEPQAHIVNGKLDYEGFLNNLSCIMKAVEKDAVLYKFILNDREMLGISREWEKALIEKLDTCFPMQLSISRDLCLELISSLYVSIIRWWLNNDMKYSPSFLAKELVKFFKSGAIGLVEQSE